VRGSAAGQAASEKSIAERARAAEPLVGIDVIDAHAHFSGTLQNGALPPGVSRLLAAMDRCGINLSLFSNSTGISAATADVYDAAHDAADAAVRAHPDRLRAYVVFHPHLLEASIAMAQRIVKPGSAFVGFKLHGVSHNDPVDGPNYRQAYAFAHRHKLPVLFHVKSSHGAETPTLKNEPLPVVLARVLDEFSGMKLIIAHFGRGVVDWAGFTAAHPNVFMETAASGVPFRVLERTVGAAGPDTILFGSDSTYLSPGAQLAKVALADISEPAKKKILAANARRLFGKSLDPSQLRA
jgi:predicted TIM-barrel fold metal-dependent hydrolase